MLIGRVGWRTIQCDLHDVYGIDTGDLALMNARTWRWLRTRIVGLVSADTRTLRALTAD